MATVILWEPVTLTFDSILPDATLTEVHRGSTTITKHPVEIGAEIADHAVVNPDTVEFDVVLSNTPIEFLAAFRNPADRANQAYGKVLQLQAEGHKAFIFTGLRDYENMLLNSWEVTRDSGKSDSVFLRIGFEQVVVVESQLVEAPEPTTERAKPRKPGGRKSKKDPSLTVESKSLAVQAVALGASIFGL